MIEHDQKNPLSLEATGCLAFSIRKAARGITQLYDEALAPLGLKSTQFSVLNAASLAEGVGINQLALLLVMDRTTLTRNLKPLRQEGLLEVGPGPDGRTRSIRLTQKGQRLLKRALPLWHDAQKRAIAKLGESRSERLRRDLAAVVNMTQ